MEVYETEEVFEYITENDGIGIQLTQREASLLRRVLNFNKTVSERVGERDGFEACDEINSFMDALGEGLKANGIARWDGK